MIEIMKKSECCGCHACYSACPKNAIEMIEDEKGFKIPNVNKKLCINCGKCEKVCPIKNNVNVKNKPIVYAAYNKDVNTMLNSSSGGIFPLLAEYILNLGGVVFGARFNEKFEVVHDYITKKDDISKFQGSKYVQSIIGNSYRDVKKFLEEGKYVLFTGTPCQIEGLLKYLNKNYDRLYTQDFICHGCPSPKVWNKYLRYQCNLKKDNIKHINFRNKKNGWISFSMQIDYTDSKYNVVHVDDIYMKAFLKNLSLRDSCYECKFKGIHRKSDITLADFWGIKKIIPDMYNELGTSLVILNSDKGIQLFEKINKNLIYKKSELNEAIKNNVSAIKSSCKTRNVQSFFDSIDKQDFVEVVNHNLPKNNILKVYYLEVKKAIKCILKKISFK